MDIAAAADKSAYFRRMKDRERKAKKSQVTWDFPHVKSIDNRAVHNDEIFKRVKVRYILSPPYI